MTHHPSFGSVLQWDPAGGTAWSAAGQVKDISGPSISRGTIDVTDHDSSSGYREFLGGLADGGDLSFTLGWDPSDADHQQGAGTGLIGDVEQETCTLPTWKLTVNTCSGTYYWTFDGFVTAFSPSTPVEGELTADVTVKITGKPTFNIPA